jgi:hypothetical protein
LSCPRHARAVCPYLRRYAVRRCRFAQGRLPPSVRWRQH